MKVNDWSAISKEQKKAFSGEVLDQIGNGKKLLGLQVVGVGKFDYNPESGECDLERKVIVYYMFHISRDGNDFHIRGFAAGQTLKYVAERSGVQIENPEQHTYIFRIDGGIRYRQRDGSMVWRVDEVETKCDFRYRGLARQGFDYLKGLAIEKKVYRVFGKIDMGIGTEGLPTFYEKMGFEVSFPEGENPVFKMNF